MPRPNDVLARSRTMDRLVLQVKAIQFAGRVPLERVAYRMQWGATLELKVDKGLQGSETQCLIYEQTRERNGDDGTGGFGQGKCPC
jgi:hypothetical protein